MIRQFMYRSFDQCYQATVGMDFVSKMLCPEGSTKAVKLQLWDTAGQERFRSLIPGYLRDCSACLVVYDITSRPSFESVRGWVAQALEDRSPGEVVIALVGNKLDLEAERQVSREEAAALAAELGIRLFFEASARTAAMVDATFNALALALPADMPAKYESDDEIVLEPPRAQNQARSSGGKKCEC